MSLLNKIAGAILALIILVPLLIAAFIVSAYMGFAMLFVLILGLFREP